MLDWSTGWDTLRLVRAGITSSIVFWYVATGVVVALGVVFVLLVRRDNRLHPPTREERRFDPPEGMLDLLAPFAILAVGIGLFWTIRRPLLIVELQLLGLVLLDWRRARRRQRRWVPRAETSTEYWRKWLRHVAFYYGPMAILSAVLFWLAPVLFRS
jgi:hypothetical protein